MDIYWIWLSQVKYTWSDFTKKIIKTNLEHRKRFSMHHRKICGKIRGIGKRALQSILENRDLMEATDYS